MSSPSPFELAQNIGNRFGNIQQRQGDVSTMSAMDQILTQASESNDPAAANRVIGQLLATVSPERQPAAIKLVEQRMSQIKADKQRTATRKAGVDPDLPEDLQKIEFKAISDRSTDKKDKQPLNLNESLNQAEKRFRERTANLTRPFEKKDSFGNIFLDLDNDEANRAKVLSKLDEELNNHMKQVAAEYKQFGAEVPNDVIEALKASFQVKVGDSVVDIEVAQDIEALNKSNPPSKFKGKFARDSKGNRVFSDGVTWSIVEENQEVAQ